MAITMESEYKRKMIFDHDVRKRIQLKELREYSYPSSYVDEDVINKNGAVIIPKGTELAILAEHSKNLDELLQQWGIESIAILIKNQIDASDLENMINSSDSGFVKIDSKFARDTVEQIRDVYLRIANGSCKTGNISNLVDQGKTLAKIVDKTPEIMFCLGHVRSSDEYTYVHSLNVALISGFLANKLFPEDKEIVQCLSVGGILHDLGKAKIPNEILNKPGSLSTSEFEIMKKHTIFGEELAMRFGVQDSRILSVIRGHHERFSGNGYPDVLNSEKISIEARIATVADVFDSLTARRVYKEPMDSKNAITLMIEKMSMHFDPSILRSLVVLIGLYPPGSVVELSDGSIGIVVGTSGNDLMRPQVMLYLDKNNKKVEELQILDLRKNDDSIFINQIIHDFGKTGF